MVQKQKEQLLNDELILASFIYQLTLFSFPGSAWECMPGGSAAYTNA